jgi:hypothetical protein
LQAAEKAEEDDWDAYFRCVAVRVRKEEEAMRRRDKKGAEEGQDRAE